MSPSLLFRRHKALHKGQSSGSSFHPKSGLCSLTRLVSVHLWESEWIRSVFLHTGRSCSRNLDLPLKECLIQAPAGKTCCK